MFIEYEVSEKFWDALWQATAPRSRLCRITDKILTAILKDSDRMFVLVYANTQWNCVSAQSNWHSLIGSHADDLKGQAKRKYSGRK